MNDCYILDGHHTPVRVPMRRWVAWWQDMAHRRVAATQVTPQVHVSTIFLGLDHRHWGAHGPPILFETMVFGGPLDQEQERYGTWEEAAAGHTAMVARVRVALGAWPPAPPGSLCEACLDAPAVVLAPAPWGGARGVCAACAPDAEEPA